MKSFDDLANTTELVNKFVRGMRALGFVLVVHDMTEGGGSFVEGYSPMSGLDGRHSREEHRSKAVYGADDLATLARQRLCSFKCVKGTMDDSISIEEDQPRLIHTAIITEGRNRAPILEIGEVAALGLEKAIIVVPDEDKPALAETEGSHTARIHDDVPEPGLVQT